MSAFGLKDAIEFHTSAGYRTFKDLAADKKVFPNNPVPVSWPKDDATKTHGPNTEAYAKWLDEKEATMPDEERGEVNEEPYSPNSPSP